MSSVKDQLQFEFAKIDTGKDSGFEELFTVDSKNNYFVNQKSKHAIGQLVFEGNSLQFKSLGGVGDDQPPDQPFDKLHFFIPMKIKLNAKTEITFSLIDFLSEDEKANVRLNGKWAAAATESLYLKQLLEPGEIPLATDLSDNDRKQLGMVSSTIELMSSPLPPQDCFDDTKVKLSIRGSLLQFDLQYEDKSLIKPINIQLNPKLDQVKGRLNLKPASNSGWFERIDRLKMVKRATSNKLRIPDDKGFNAIYTDIKREAEEQVKNAKTPKDETSRLVPFIKLEKKLRDLFGSSFKDFLFYDFYNQHDFVQKFINEKNTPDKWVELKDRELKDRDAIEKSVKARFGGPYLSTLIEEFKKNPNNKPASFYKNSFDNKRKDAFEGYRKNLFNKDDEEALVNCVDLPLEGMTDVLSWQKVLRQRLVKAYYYPGVIDGQNHHYEKVFQTDPEFWIADHPTEKWEDLPQPKKNDAKSANNKSKEKLRKQWETESNDSAKLREFYDDLLKKFNLLGNDPPFSRDPEIIFNICSGVIAGKLQQELNPTYMCSLARKRLVLAEELLETQKIRDVLSANIQIKVGAKSDPVPVIIGSVRPSPLN